MAENEIKPSSSSGAVEKGGILRKLRRRRRPLGAMLTINKPESSRHKVDIHSFTQPRRWDRLRAIQGQLGILARAGYGYGSDASVSGPLFLKHDTDPHSFRGKVGRALETTMKVVLPVTAQYLYQMRGRGDISRYRIPLAMYSDTLSLPTFIVPELRVKYQSAAPEIAKKLAYMGPIRPHRQRGRHELPRE